MKNIYSKHSLILFLSILMMPFFYSCFPENLGRLAILEERLNAGTLLSRDSVDNTMLDSLYSTLPSDSSLTQVNIALDSQLKLNRSLIQTVVSDCLFVEFDAINTDDIKVDCTLANIDTAFVYIGRFSQEKEVLVGVSPSQNRIVKVDQKYEFIPMTSDPSALKAIILNSSVREDNMTISDDIYFRTEMRFKDRVFVSYNPIIEYYVNLLREDK